MYEYKNPTKEVLDVSAYIFRRLRKLGLVEALKLQKLLYYSNAWSLADRGVPMFSDEIQAWKHGPVVAAIYPLHRGEIELATWPHGDADALAAADKDHVDNIIDTYGGLSGWRLRNLTHNERPWKEAWAKAQQGKVLRVQVDPEVTAEFYREFRARA